MFSGCSNELIMKIKSQYKNIKEEAFSVIIFFDYSDDDIDSEDLI